MAMILTDLQATFIHYLAPGWTDPDGEVYPHGGTQEVGQLAEADGLEFLCPKCYVANGGEVGTHRVICWFVCKVPDDVRPGPGRWTPQGTGLNDLSFVPSEGRSHSVLLTGGGCAWHGFVTDGKAE